MNEETTYLHENESPKDHATSSCCNEKTVSLDAPVLNTQPKLAYQTEITMDTPVNINLSEKYSPEKGKETAVEALEYSEEIKQPTEEENIQLYDFCNIKSHNFSHCTDLQTKQPNIASSEFGDMSNAGHLDVCFNGVSGEQENTNIPASGPVPILPFTRISLAPPSHQNPREGSEGLSWQDSVTMQDGFHEEVSGPDITTEEIVVSPMSSLACHITDGGKGHTQVFDMPFENLPACHQQLFNSNRETSVTKEVEADVSNVTCVSTQICAELKEQEDTRQVSLSLAGVQTEGSQTTDTPGAFNSLNPHGHMVEIDLNEDAVNSESETRNSVSRKPQQLHIDLSKYTELLGQHKAAVNLLKRSVVKGVITQGTKLRDVVNEKLSITSKSQETPRPNKLVADADTLPPYQVSPNNLTIVTSSMSRGGATPYLPMPGSNNSRDQIFQHNLVADVGNITGAASAIEKDNVAMVKSGSYFTDRSMQQLIPSAPIIHSQFNNFSTPFRSSPDNTTSFLHSTVTQSPGPIRGYSAFNPPQYGFPIPPSMPPPPPVPAMVYFANRYSTVGQSAPGSVPVMGIAPSTIDRERFGQMAPQRSPLTRYVNYMSSFLHLKSNAMKDSLHRKMSASLSQTSPAGPESDLFMEEGQIHRASIHSGSQQFRHRGLQVLTADDLLMGALCCCCWPLGLAARLVTLTIPDSNGPVDSCIRAMSQQVTSISLVLGIASYFVFLMLWLSMFVVTAK